MKAILCLLLPLLLLLGCSKPDYVKEIVVSNGPNDTSDIPIIIDNFDFEAIYKSIFKVCNENDLLITVVNDQSGENYFCHDDGKNSTIGIFPVRDEELNVVIIPIVDFNAKVQSTRSKIIEQELIEELEEFNN